MSESTQRGLWLAFLLFGAGTFLRECAIEMRLAKIEAAQLAPARSAP